MAGFTTAGANLSLAWITNTGSPTRPAGSYIALFTVAPTDAGGGTEVTGGSYARQAITWTTPSGASTQPNATVTFPTASADWGTIVAAAIFDASTSGTMLLWNNVTVSKSILNGDTASFTASNLTFTLD